MDLAPRSGSEQSGRRPCIIVSVDTFTSNPRWGSITVVPLTASAKWQRSSPMTVLFQAGESNLPKDCAALAHQITTLDKSKVVGPAIGRLSASKMMELEAALVNYLLR